jgi:colanic acid biosynthesis glycosyl transferase WcaI
MRRSCPNNQTLSKIDHRNDIIRKATTNDLAGIVEIHQQAFGNFFLTRLGSNFLRQYYSLVLEYDLRIILVSAGLNELNGFVCGFLEPVEFYRLMWRRRLTFALPVFSALLHHPSLLNKVMYSVRRIQRTASDRPPGSCELSSIAVAAETTGNGFGKALIRAFIAEAQSMGARCVYLTTDARDNDASNAFYRHVGFQHSRRFRQPEGRWMNEYVISGWESSRDREVRS